MNDTIWQIIQNQPIAEGIFEMLLHTDDFSHWTNFQPGQFVHVRVPNAPQLLLRRPLSVHETNPKHCAIVLQYAVVGAGTQALSQLGEGEVLTAVGPIGRGFPVDPSARRIWLLGGGIGVAPLYTLIQAMPKAEYTAFLGYRDGEHVYGLTQWERAADVRLYTDDGSQGICGFAMDGLMKAMETERPDVMYACGPTPMLRALAQSQDRLPVPCYVSMEERMACGIGACLVCTCRTQTPEGVKNKRVCVDGPVFDLKEVDFA